MPAWIIIALKIASLIISLLLSFKAGERLEQERQRPLRTLIERLTERWLAPKPEPVKPSDAGDCKCGAKCKCREVGDAP